MKIKFLSFCILFLLMGCDNSSESTEPESGEFNSDTRGIGFFDYEGYAPFQDKQIRVYFYIPDAVTSTSEILFVFHGNGRNAKDYRNAMIEKADEYNFIVIAPRFSSEDFPGGDAYILGNVFVDGDNPSEDSLNEEADWTFSVVEPIFDFVTGSIDNLTTSYKAFGHSAGGQFAHRFWFFKPQARVNEIVVSAPGWYTAVDYETSFPYGFKNSPLENVNLSSLLSKSLHIIVGDEDNDPNASSLRRNSIVDQQGTNRLDRAFYFYSTAMDMANDNGFQFNWSYETIPNVGHEYIETSKKAADLLFN
jgi:hypothetical protein